MGRKGGKYKKRDMNTPNKSSIRYNNEDEDVMNDEIDAFHKQRDIVPLDIEDVAPEDSDNEHPVLDFEDDDDDEEDNDDEEDEDDDDDDDDDDDVEDDRKLTGLAAKIARQEKYTWARSGGVEDDMHDDTKKDEEERVVWSRRKKDYYDADNVDYELQSSDDNLPDEEEEEILRLQKEKAKTLSMEDFGLEDLSKGESDLELTFEQILVQGKSASKVSAHKEANDEPGAMYEMVKKDLNSLTKEEQMDIVYSSAPELVGLLSELNDAVELLENKVTPLLSKMKEGQNAEKGGMRYMEVKQLLLLSYCQAITFYLLLKSEGQPVRDHPVISRLVEIKNLLDKMKELDSHLPSDLETLLSKNISSETPVKVVVGNTELQLDSSPKVKKLPVASSEQPRESAELPKVNIKDHKDYELRRKRQEEQVDLQSSEMLKVRAALEEKLKQKGIFSSFAERRDRAKKRIRLANGRQLETLDDFDDDATEAEGANHVMSNGNSSLSHSNKLLKLVHPQTNKNRIISGDGDIPKRDDIGERRRKHELRVLAGAGIESSDAVEEELGDLASCEPTEADIEGESGSDLEFYREVERQHAAKVAAKAEIYSRTSAVPSQPTLLVDGKRQISYQIEKNRGLTRPRKKQIKNPRTKNRLKHEKKQKQRKGQVQEVRKPSGPYGGEATGINTGISRSRRL